MIKFHGYLGGHYPNIGTTRVTRIIGAIGRSGTRFGTKTTCQASKSGIAVLFLCPIRSGEINSEHHHLGEKSQGGFRTGRTSNFDCLQPRDNIYESDIPPSRMFFKSPQSKI